MPHDATPDNGRMRPFGSPSWRLALVLTVIAALGAALVAAAAGVFLFALPAIAVAVIVYGAYRLYADRWRHAVPREFRGLAAGRGHWLRRPKTSVIADVRALRRRSRSVGPELP
jgi:hypothetical protein